MTINPYARQARNYREHDILNADPVKLVVLTYDAAIAACGRKDLGTATRAIHELIKSLDFDHGDLPVRLLALYQWTSDECRSGRWDSAAEVLLELRSTWSELQKQTMAGPLPAVAALA
ncbi:MAG: hypothetical protein DWI61_00055 [Chloroflexi bacterium]|nr:MAG: hypothetical protein DWI61_00055 [Chloroflexota bacterium]